MLRGKRERDGRNSRVKQRINNSLNNPNNSRRGVCIVIYVSGRDKTSVTYISRVLARTARSPLPSRSKARGQVWRSHVTSLVARAIPDGSNGYGDNDYGKRANDRDNDKRSERNDVNDHDEYPTRRAATSERLERHRHWCGY